MKLNQTQTRNNIRLALPALLMAILFNAEVMAAEGNGTPTAVDAAAVFAKVGNTVITFREYNAQFAAANRGVFYHGKPPESTVAKLQREMADKLVNDILLVNEAKRLKLKPEDVADKVKQFEQKNANNPRWQDVREKAVASFTKQAEEESLRKLLEKQVRNVRTPTEKQVRAYYAAHPDKFTEPEQIRVSIIMLNVDPGDPAAWDPAYQRGKELVKELRGGADFAEYAAKYSGDVATVDQGGDMGYLHGGMLTGLAAETVGKLKPGEISDPVGMMEGVAIFKLVDRKDAKLNSFDAVKERASELLAIDEGERAWKGLIAQLRKKTPITVNESRFVPLTEAAAPAAK